MYVLFIKLVYSLIQVSEYLKKQMIEAEQGNPGDNEEVKKMLADHDKLVEEIFQHEDKDRNGFISHEEFSGPKHDELWSIFALVYFLEQHVSWSFVTNFKASNDSFGTSSCLPGFSLTTTMTTRTTTLSRLREF